MTDDAFNHLADMCGNCKHARTLPPPATEKQAMERPGNLGCTAYPDVEINPTWTSSWCPKHERDDEPPKAWSPPVAETGAGR